MLKNTIFLKVYFSKLFRFLGVVLSLQLLYCFSFNQPYEKSDFLAAFVCSLLYMTSSTEKTYKETVRLTNEYYSSLSEKNKLDDNIEKEK